MKNVFDKMLEDCDIHRDQEELAKQLEEQEGYTNVCVKNGRVCGIGRFIFTTAIIADMDETGYKERWCYHTGAEALQEFAAWDGVDDPEGWHKHVPSGRRRDENGKDLGAW